MSVQLRPANGYKVFHSPACWPSSFLSFSWLATSRNSALAVVPLALTLGPGGAGHGCGAGRRARHAGVQQRSGLQRHGRYQCVCARPVRPHHQHHGHVQGTLLMPASRLCSHFAAKRAFPPQRTGAAVHNTLLTPLGGVSFLFQPLCPPKAAQLVGKLGGRVGTAALPGSTVVLDRATRE